MAKCPTWSTENCAAHGLVEGSCPMASNTDFLRNGQISRDACLGTSKLLQSKVIVWGYIIHFIVQYSAMLKTP